MLVLAALLAGCGPASGDLYTGELPERVDFNFHVKPILSDRCFACHGPDAGSRKADLRLDTPEGARAVIRARSLRRSEFFHRIVSDDSSQVMPPRESGLALSDYEKAVLARWIEQGAEYRPHWAFIPPEKPELPRVRDTAWARSPIDRFVLARLEREGLRPSAEAARERLIRRVTFDLTGLPPTLEEIDRFARDRSPDAYEKVVDRLLASPAYGERMAVEWMDLARYADSNGYQDDGVRHMWRWRDWVIEAYNRNQPYDEFVTWQLAGDLLPNATREQVLATGFNRNHPVNGEGGIVDEEYRVEYVADRANTFSRAFMGMSLECARCHDHKYDPVSQKDYFRIFAFFNSNHEIGISAIDSNTGPVMVLLDDTTEQRLRSVRGEIAEREAALRRYLEQAARDGGHLSRVPAPPDPGRGLLGHFPLDEVVDRRSANLADRSLPARISEGAALVPGRLGQALEIQEGPGSVNGPYRFERNDPFTLSAWVNPSRRRSQSPVLSMESSGNRHHRGYQLALDSLGRVTATLSHSWPTNSLRIVTRDTVPLNAWTHLVMSYDGSSRAEGLRLYVDGRPAPVEVTHDNLSRTIIWHPTREVNFLIGAKGGSTDPSVFPGGRIDEVRVYGRALTAPEAARLAGLDPFAELRGSQSGQWSERQRTDLLSYHLATADRGHAAMLAELRRVRAEENRLLSEAGDVMIMQELPEPRPTFVLDRGMYDAPTDPVRPGTPASILPYEGLPPNRLGLAKWLFDPAHPLAARVPVNRYWQMLFGAGLVRTSDDFGNQGELPSHPELLDWLAVTYRESGWDTRAMLKQMVMSSTYRQSSSATPDLLERDPENRLLARGPSYRMPFEMVRDGALAAGGLLVHRVGGPSVKPYQPPGLWEEKSAGRGSLATYVQDTGESLYRRSLYTFWKRSSPPPAMMSFDASDRSVCTVRRARTNTPLQALGLLNDPQFVEAARLLAERMLLEGGSESAERLRFGFRTVTARAPSPREMRLLMNLHREQLAHFRAGRGGPLSLLQVGERKRDERLPADELAAYTVVANTLLNLDEFVTKR